MNAQMDRLVIHIGYHKTGTTYLQRSVFAHHPSIVFLGQPFPNYELRCFLRQFKFTPDLEFSDSHMRERFRHLADKVIGEKSPQAQILVPLLSVESLHSGSEWFGARVVEMAERIHAVFSPCKILLTIRNQADYILSNYREYVIHGGRLHLNSFLQDSFQYECWLRPKLHYDRMLELYAKLFGEEMVGVVLFEDFREDVRGTVRGILEYAGVDPMEDINLTVRYGSLSDAAVKVLRHFNRLLCGDFVEQYNMVGRPQVWPSRERVRRKMIAALRKVGPLLGCKSTSGLMSESQRRMVKDHFSQSNRALSEMLGRRDLASIGYFCE